MDRFKYVNFHKLKNNIKSLHERILQSKESDLDKKFDRNFYNIFTDWIIELVQYGTLISISLIIFKYEPLTLLAWVIPLGVMRWLVFDFIKTYKNLK